MGSSSKRSKDKESKKRRHHSRDELQTEEAPREKKHKHHHHHHRKHHKDRKREKRHRTSYESGDSDVEIVSESTVVPVTTPAAPQIQKEASVEASGGYHESLSVDETNKIRAKLGLRPLQSSAGGESSKKDDGKKKDDLGEFYHKPADSLTDKIRQEKIRSRLSDHKEKRSLESKLSKVKLLSTVHNVDDDDAAAWVKKSRKIDTAKRDAEKRAKMLEEMDAQFGIGEIIESEQRIKRMQQYSEHNLRGLQVNHDIDTFKEGHTVILTLKDQAVLDEDDDTLVNVNMLDNERYQKSKENKKKKPVYSGYDNDDEIDEFGDLKPKSLLSKYDEEIDGEKRDFFKIGFDNALERKQARLQSIKDKLANKLVDTLVMPELTIASDYYNEEELAKFKKPKRKRKMRVKGKLTADDLERAGQPSIDYDDTIALPANTKIEVKMDDENEDTLERALHKTRKFKQKEALAIPEVKPEPDEEEAVDTGNITLNATAEFCRTLGDIPTYGKSGNREESENLLDLEDEDKEDSMEIEEPEEIDEGGRWNAVDPNRVVKQQITIPVIETPILEEEPDLSSGVGAALKLAMSKGYLDKEENNRPSNSRLAYLQAQHYSIEDKNYTDEMERGAGGGGGGANRRERFSGPITDFREKDLYKPNVKLEYIDDEGHILNAKEAFRYLSHKFHGKGPGKNKVEKRLKKVVQEGLMKKMSSTDTPLGTLNMLQSKQKEMQSPYIVLSGGKHTHSTTISKARR